MKGLSCPGLAGTQYAPSSANRFSHSSNRCSSRSATSCSTNCCKSANASRGSTRLSGLITTLAEDIAPPALSVGLLRPRTHQIAPGVVLGPLSDLARAIPEQDSIALVDLLAKAACDQHPIRAAGRKTLLAALEGLQVIALDERGGRVSDVDEAHDVDRDFGRCSLEAYWIDLDLGLVDADWADHPYRGLRDKDVDAG